METGLRQVVQNRLNEKLQRGTERCQQFVVDIQNELSQNRDFLAPFGRKGLAEGGIEFSSNGHLRMDFQNNSMQLNPHAITQIGAKLNIPTDYLRKLSDGGQEKRDLAAYMLNAHRQWMDEDKRFLIRSVGNEVRGVLSDSYKRINSKLILNSFFSEVKDSEAVFADCLLTPTRYWMEAIIPRIFDIQTEKNGLVYITFGARIGNSDFGDGALDIRSFIMLPICMNGAVRESLMNKVHLGSKLGDNLALSQETYDYESKMMASAVKDITRLALNATQIRNNIAIVQKASDMSISLDREFLSLATKQVTKGEIQEITNLMQQSDPNDGLFGEATLWKLTQGITAYGKNVGGRRERELAQIAGELLERASEPSTKFLIAS